MKASAAICAMVILGCSQPILVCGAAEAVEPLAVADKSAGVRLSAGILRETADGALASGLPSVACDMFARAAEADASLFDDEQFLSSYAMALMASGGGDEAHRLLLAHQSPRPWWRLFLALSAMEQGRVAEAKTLFTQPINPTDIPPAYLPWLNLAQGMIKSADGDIKGAAAEYAKVVQESPSLLGPQAELLILRDQIAQGGSGNEAIAQLRQRMKENQGQRSGFDAARLLAIALSQAGRQLEALTVLDEQLQFIGSDEDGMREDLLLLLGSIAGPDTARGRAALQQVLLNRSASMRDMENALGLLYAARGEGGAVPFRTILDNVISTVPTHPLMDKLLILRSGIAMQAGQLDAATADAQRIIDQFPASSLRQPALRMLAYLSFLRVPPQYRTAASYLSLLRSEQKSDEARALTGVLIADCFYQNGDFANSSAAYADAYDEPVPDKGLVFYQMILSELGAGRIEDARKALDDPAVTAPVGPMHLWRAHWNLIHAMRQRGQSAEAYERLNKLLSAPTDKAPPPALRLRLMWLEAQLSLDAGQPGATPGKCRAILEAVDAAPVDVLDADQRVIISSQTLLLNAQALLAVDNEKEAESILTLLRDKYANSTAAENSYLAQARYLAQHERLVEAQRLLLTLADRYPTSSQAPVALWEAAISAEQRGLDATYREAISLLDRLVSDYPGSSLVFYARIRQGDILRKLNDFNTALLAYEDVINRFPSHTDLYLAQMSRADCIIAQSDNNPARLADGIAVYERLTERQDVPVDFRAEASFKWAFNLDKQGDTSRATDAYWVAINRFLASDASSPMGARGRYWISRCAVELGQLLESAKRYSEARRVYTIMLTSNLPGRALAQARLNRLDEPKVQQ
jgi:tetratricopeptide (TPR) repeat protein